MTDFIVKLTDFTNNLDRSECEVRFSEQLSKYTTFRIGGVCDVMLIPHSVSCLADIVKFCSENNIRTFVMGKGSDLLFDDEGFRGAVILLNKELGGAELTDENTVRAFAGVPLMTVCKTALEVSLTGLEFAYGIPGSVGGAVFMNAGAYGGEMKHVLSSVTAMDMGGEVHVYQAEELDLSYRHSRFTESGEIIISADFWLQKGSRAEIESKMNELMQRRRDKQPLDLPSAGSTFKRPEGQFAGKLIQDCGLQGYRIGGAQVSEKHCGFVVNTGGATYADVTALIEYVQKNVLEKTGFLLEPEVRVIPAEM